MITSRSFSKIFAASALALGLLACSSDDPTPAAGAAGSPGSTTSRAESCTAIETGAKVVIQQAVKQAQAGGAAGAGGAGGAGGQAQAGAPGAGGSAGSPSFCDTYFKDCTDTDLAALAPQYQCFSAHPDQTPEEARKSCPEPASLSDACNAGLTRNTPQEKGKYASPEACYANCSDLYPPDNTSATNDRNGCNIGCFFVWWLY